QLVRALPRRGTSARAGLLRQPRAWRRVRRDRRARRPTERARVHAQVPRRLPEPVRPEQPPRTAVPRGAAQRNAYDGRSRPHWSHRRAAQRRDPLHPAPRPRRAGSRGKVMTDAVLPTATCGHLAGGTLVLAIPVAFLAGLISFLSPCVLPLVPGYLSYVTGLSGA